MSRIDPSARHRLNHGWTYFDRVHADAQGQTVLDFYARYPHSSREDWQQRIQSGAVLLNGHRTQPDVRLSVGQLLAYHRAPWREPDVPRSFAVLHRDHHVLAVAKPSGLPVLPGGHHLENTLLACVRERYGNTPAPVHRLGRATSGIVLFARTPLAKQRLSQDFRSGRIQKLYRALATGAAMPDRFSVDKPIGRVPYPVIGALHAVDPHGRPSRSDCRVLHRDPQHNRALLEVDILTGRPHQIRIHLAAAGYPLVGDPLYRAGGLPVAHSGNDPLPLPGDCGYHLHAHRIRFSHPQTRRTVTVTCLPPPILRTPEERALQ